MVIENDFWGGGRGHGFARGPVLFGQLNSNRRP